jgi:uncharacterized protein
VKILFSTAAAFVIGFSSVQVQAQTSPATASDVAPLAVGETFTIQSNVLRETRRINVYLPAGYARASDMRLPVMYMPDGGIAEDFLHVAGLLQVSIGNGTMRPFILVGIENTERRRDLTGPTRSAEDAKIAPRVGGSALFRTFIRTELMPIVKARYRTTSETAIIGESLAGLFVVETLFVEPDLFDTYIAFDPSLWWNTNELVDSAAARLRRRLPRPVSLYLANSAEKELAALMARFTEELKLYATSDLTWFHVSMPGETHGTIYHPAALQAVRKLFKPATSGR